MATNYQGYLMKVSDSIVSGKFFQSYKSTPNRQSDLKSMDGLDRITHRNVLPHTRTTITFNHSTSVLGG